MWNGCIMMELGNEMMLRTLNMDIVVLMIMNWVQNCRLKN